MSGLDIACRQQQQAASVWYAGIGKPTESREIGRTKKFNQLAVAGRFRNGGPRKSEHQTFCCEKIEIGHQITITILREEPNKTERPGDGAQTSVALEAAETDF